MHKWKGMALFLVVLCMVFSGCDSVKVPENIQENAVVIDKSGSISEYLVDTFDKTFYDVSELERMCKEDAEGYNEANRLPDGAVPVEVKKVALLDQESDKVLVNRLYDKADTFERVSEKDFFYGTVASARAQLERVGNAITLKHVKKEETKQILELITMSEKHIIITDMKTVLYCPYSVEYVSEGVVIREDGGVDTLNVSEDSLAIVVMKK